MCQFDKKVLRSHPKDPSQVWGGDVGRSHIKKHNKKAYPFTTAIGRSLMVFFDIPAS